MNDWSAGEKRDDLNYGELSYRSFDAYFSPNDIRSKLAASSNEEFSPTERYKEIFSSYNYLGNGNEIGSVSSPYVEERNEILPTESAHLRNDAVNNDSLTAAYDSDSFTTFNLYTAVDSPPTVAKVGPTEYMVGDKRARDYRPLGPDNASVQQTPVSSPTISRLKRRSDRSREGSNSNGPGALSSQMNPAVDASTYSSVLVVDSDGPLPLIDYFADVDNVSIAFRKAGPGGRVVAGKFK